MTTQAIEQLQAFDDYSNCMGLVGKSEIGIKELVELVIENEEILAYLDKIAIQKLELPGVEKSFYIPEGKYFMVERVKNMLLDLGKLPSEIYGN